MPWSSRSFVWLLAASFVGGLCLLPATQAHEAGIPAGYTRMVHDCNDDYGSEGLLQDAPPGHDVHALDVREGTIDGTPMFLVRVTLSPQAAGDNNQASEEIRFETPRHTGSGAIRTLVDTPRLASGTTITFVEGTEPAHMETGMPAYYSEADGGEEDNGRFSFELGYTYDQLEVENGDAIKAFFLQGYHRDGSGARQQADHLPGSYAGAADPDACDDAAQGNAAYQATGGYTVEASDWTPPSDDDGDTGDNGSGTNAAPTVAFTFSPANPSTADTITFTDDSSDSDGTVTGWDWEFGDGTTATGATATHRYSDDGTYTVTLWATDDGGATRQTERTVQVSNQAPTARIGLPTTATAGTGLQFHDESSDPDGTVVGWQWSFGDGGTSDAESPVHTYAEPGTYDVRLEVVDDDGATHSTTTTLTVKALGEEAPGPTALSLLLITGLAFAALCRRR